MTSNLTKTEIKMLCLENGIENFEFFNFCSINKSVNIYWSNPDKECLTKNWVFVLNDNENRTLKCLVIPPNSISEIQLKTRKDKPYKLDIQIDSDNVNLRDTRSGIFFGRWLIKTISY